MRYAIWEGNMEKLRKKITTIQKKCRKYGCEFRYEEVGEEFRDVDDGGRKIKARFVLIEVEGKAVINDWKFIAAIDSCEGGNIIRKVSDEYEVPRRYWYCELFCEHCKTARYRKNVFLVRNEKTGEWKMVGRQCLRDFTFGMDAGAAASLLDGIHSLNEYEAPLGGGWGNTRYLNVRDFLLYAAETIKKFGYVKVDGDGIPTKLRALQYYEADHGGLWPEALQEEIKDEMKRREFDPEHQEELVDKALEWIREKDAYSDYIHNLKMICSGECAEYNKAGFLASMVVAYEKEMGLLAERRAREKAEKKSDWVGNENDKITVEMKSHEVVASWESVWGYVMIYKIIGNDDNVYTWKTSKCISSNAKKIRGTVKAHNEYRGVRQTELTRCRVMA